MVKLKAPKWTGDYERYKKMLLIWLRTIEDNSATDKDIVSAVILGLDKATGDASRACELVLDIEEDTLYPDLATIAGVATEVQGQARENAIKDYFKNQMDNHPEKKVTVGKTEKIIPGNKASLNFDSDQLVMDGKVQDLITLPSNHYAIAVGRNEKSLECQKIENNYVLNEVFYEVEDPKKMALKIHRYFAHASPVKLKKFVNQSNHQRKQDIIKELGNLDCNLCKKYLKEAPRPKTCLPMADKFNQTVALDLKFLDNGEILLHVIDLLTRFSAAMLVEN